MIVPSFNQRDALMRTLELVKASSGVSFEVLVVDDGSSDQSAHMAERSGWRVLRRQVNRGAAAARNLGARHARGEILVFLDADVELEPDTLRRLKDFFNDEHTVAAQPITDWKTANKPAGFCAKLCGLVWHYMLARTECQRSRWVSMPCFAIRRSALERVDWFDESFRGAGGEEFEFSRRLTSLGDIRSTPDLRVRHRFKPFRHFMRNLFRRARLWPRLLLHELSLRPRRFLRCVDLSGGTWSGAIAAAGWLLPALVCAALGWLPGSVPLALLGLQFLLLGDFFNFVRQRGGLLFSLRAVPLVLLWLHAQAFGFWVGVGEVLLGAPARLLRRFRRVAANT